MGDSIHIPVYLCFARVEGEVESRLAIRKDANVHYMTLVRLFKSEGLCACTHNAFIGHICVALQVEENRHVVCVICSIETRNVDKGASQAVPKTLCIECRFPIVGQVYGMSVTVCRLYILIVLGAGEIHE